MAALPMPGVLENTSVARPMANAHSMAAERDVFMGIYASSSTPIMGVPIPQKLMWLSTSTCRARSSSICTSRFSIVSIIFSAMLLVQ